jgi:hypothetical protein
MRTYSGQLKHSATRNSENPIPHESEDDDESEEDDDDDHDDQEDDNDLCGVIFRRQRAPESKVIKDENTTTEFAAFKNSKPRQTHSAE